MGVAVNLRSRSTIFVCCSALRSFFWIEIIRMMLQVCFLFFKRRRDLSALVFHQVFFHDEVLVKSLRTRKSNE